MVKRRNLWRIFSADNHSCNLKLEITDIECSSRKRLSHDGKVKTSTKGSRDGAVVRALGSHQCGASFIPAQCHRWVEFVVGSFLASRVFSLFSGFPSSTKTNISKFQFNQDRRFAWKPAKADEICLIYWNLFNLLNIHTLVSLPWAGYRDATRATFSNIIQPVSKALAKGVQKGNMIQSDIKNCPRVICCFLASYALGISHVNHTRFV